MIWVFINSKWCLSKLTNIWNNSKQWIYIMDDFQVFLLNNEIDYLFNNLPIYGDVPLKAAEPGFAAHSSIKSFYLNSLRPT